MYRVEVGVGYMGLGLGENEDGCSWEEGCLSFVQVVCPTQLRIRFLQTKEGSTRPKKGRGRSGIHNGAIHVTYDIGPMFHKPPTSHHKEYCRLLCHTLYAIDASILI